MHVIFIRGLVQALMPTSHIIIEKNSIILNGFSAISKSIFYCKADDSLSVIHQPIHALCITGHCQYVYVTRLKFLSVPQWTIRSRCLLGQRSWWGEQWNICLRRRMERKMSGEVWCCREPPSWPTGTTSPTRRTRCCTCISCGTTTRTETCVSYLNQVQKSEPVYEVFAVHVCSTLKDSNLSRSN